MVCTVNNPPESSSASVVCTERNPPESSSTSVVYTVSNLPESNEVCTPSESELLLQSNMVSRNKFTMQIDDGSIEWLNSGPIQTDVQITPSVLFAWIIRKI